MRFRVLALTLASGLLTAPLAPEAQQSAKVYRIGVLTGGSRPSPTAPSPPQGGPTGPRMGGGQEHRLRGAVRQRKARASTRLAAELITLKVDVIVTFGTTAALAARKATSTVPIVLGMIGDPVRVGLVTSLARPGGNVTGNSLIAPELGVKRLELLKDMLPNVRRIAVPYDPANPAAAAFRNEQEAGARSLGLELHYVEVRHPDDLETAFQAMALARVDAVLVFSDPTFFSARDRMMQLALKHRLPSMSEGKEFVAAGGLMSYSPSIPALTRRAAVFIDKILKGTRPEDLPIEQPTKFELVVNLKTAKVLGLTIPPSVLARADEVIE